MHNKVIVVTDQLQDMEVQISIQHTERDSLGEEFFKTEGKTDNVRGGASGDPANRFQLSVNAAGRQPAAAAEDVAGSKRKRGASPPVSTTDKKARPEPKTQEVVMLDD